VFSSSNHSEKKLFKDFFVLKGIFLILLLIVILILFTVFGEYYDIDRRFSSQFFVLEKEWFLSERFPWNWLYDYGVIPGILLTLISFFLWLFYRTNSRFASLRSYFLICGFTPIVASLIIVNIILKDHTGRPRPREITNFNGNLNYKPVLEVGIPGKGHSFPCGHCSIAFTLTSGIVFFRRSVKFAIFSFSIGLAYGIAMSMARIVQGGHFLSDAIWSLGIVWLTLLVFYYFIFKPPLNELNPVENFSKKQKFKIFSSTFIFLAILIIFIFTRRPFYKNHFSNFEIKKDIKQLDLYIPENWNLATDYLSNINEGKFFLEIKGFAPPYTTHYLNFTSKDKGEKMKLIFKENIFGYKRNFTYKLKLTIPNKLKDKIEIIKEFKKNKFKEFM
tara:strand:- start:1147 stop:2313 length:1167 start_codon:yes stop_codon:yes gene_type:complete